MWPFTKRKLGARKTQPLTQEELLKLSIQEKLKMYNAQNQGRASFSGSVSLYGGVLQSSRNDYEFIELDDVSL